ncbi:MAG TPA: 3-deoxy-7-phosphoheptulonate synthase [Candidatus Eisenbacteria bacterium]|nr:3-deoxy-7-phosphoheptulonate synthase [Candidatus Eisenbacteria bacterium]
MIITLEPDAPEAVIASVIRLSERYEGVTAKKYEFRGATTSITEIHLIGSTRSVPTDIFENVPGVLKAVRVSVKYRLIGRHSGEETPGFEYNGVRFDERSVKLFAGLCAVDKPQHVGEMMAALHAEGIDTTRMGAYKPRTSPYDFQGLGKSCLPWVFELAGKHGMKVIAMEVTDARHVDEIRAALAAAGKPTGVMLQIGTRNTQNFELLKCVGQQKEFPVLFKRGMGITLEESLNACEYVASEGNPNIVFCLRGVKTHLGEPHRNFVDFAHVPVVRRQTRLPVCIDPSHSVGRLDLAPDGLSDIFHVIGQGVIAGATMILVDFHPKPELALCDGPQALALSQLGELKRYISTIRRAYETVTKPAV